jgi:hypothetical protein
MALETRAVKDKDSSLWLDPKSPALKPGFQSPV